MLISPKEQIKQRKIITAAHTAYRKTLISHATFKLNDKATGDDLVQNTFKKTWIHVLHGGKINMMKSFLYHILNNLIIDEYRKRKFKTVSLERLHETGFDHEDETSESLLNQIDGRKASLLIVKLPKIYRTVISLRFMKNMPIKEIAHTVHRSKNTVTVQIHRGILQLRKLYHHL